MTASARLPLTGVRSQADIQKSETEMRVWKRTVRRIPVAASIAKSESIRSYNRSSSHIFDLVYSHLMANIYCPFDLGYENSHIHLEKADHSGERIDRGVGRAMRDRPILNAMTGRFEDMGEGNRSNSNA